LFGLPLHRHRQEVLARVGGLVERPDFYLYLSARKNLEIVAALAGGVPERLIDEVLAIVSLTDRADDRVKTYSHGMKQRLGIAQALLGSPDFIILDEPTSGLDPQGIKEVRELIRRLSVERSMTVLLSSHLLSEIEQTATSMAIINGGRLIVQGGVEELLATGDVHLQIDARPLEQAIVLLQGHPGVSDLKRNNAFVECTVSQDIVGHLNRLLVDGCVEVRAFVPKRSLEEYFLAITEGASEVAPSGRGRQG
jgi:ABC-2 type transport system ATP-binding protein